MTIELRPGGLAGAGPVRKPPGEASVRGARLILFWERLWPALLPAFAPGFLLLVLALFGVLAVIPGWAHWALLAAAATATGCAAFRYGREVVWPTRREALERLERDGKVAHAPLQALEDRPFAPSAGENPLWLAHLDDMRRRAGAARLKAPRATADTRDPYVLRYGAIGLLLVALVAAGPDRDARIAAMLTPSGNLRGGALAADLWIEPPAYTGKAPIILVRAGAAVAGAHQQVDAPEGAAVIAQGAGARRLRLTLTTPESEVEAVEEAGRLTLALSESGLLRLRVGGAEGRWPIGVIADDAPAAMFIETPTATEDARLALAVSLEDDYGIVGAAIRLRLSPDQPRPLDAPDFDEASIRDERVIELDGLAGKSGERRFDLDLQADPWAGLDVVGRLVVRDGAGQEGATEETSFTLPARPFFNPLARAVVEQRQTLAVAPASWQRAGRSFDALTLAPESFYERPTDYLLIRTAFWRVMRQDGQDFSETVDEFWPLALQLEDEALELARRRLEAAQEALRQALERSASDAEVSRLVEELREAMRQYLQALAQSGQDMAESGAEDGSQSLNEGDLEQMLDEIRDLAQSGAEGAARQALSDLQNILNNLRLSGRGGGQRQGQPGEGQEGGGAGEAGDLIGRQRELANRSYERGRTPGASGDDLAAEESGIAEDLNALRERLEEGGQGADPDGAAGEAFGEALREMQRAEEALQGGDFAAADSAMERAIGELREGAEALAEAEGRQARQGGGERAGESGRGLDPLGRPLGEGAGRGVEVPEGSDAQRARDVLNELRRRLSDGKRNEEEIRYLERLLERF